MPAFSYRARTRDGRPEEGVVEAADRRLALAQLESRGLIPIRVSEDRPDSIPAAEARRERPRLRFGSGRRRMGNREVLLFTGELADLLSAGMTLGNALHTLARQAAANSARADIIGALRDDIISGSSLSAALARRPDVFGTLYVNMVRAGEAGGALAAALRRLYEHYTRVQHAREQVLTALIYPAIILLVGTGTMIFAMVFVIPRFTGIFEELGSALPLMTQALVIVSDMLLRYGWLLAIALVLAGVGLRRVLRTAGGRAARDRLLLRLPIARGIVRANAFAHFSRTLAALLINGVPVLSALRIVEQTVGNTVIAGEIRRARERVTDGSSISGPLAAGREFPPMLTDMLAVGEQTGNMSGALEKIAVRYDGELDRSIKVLTTVLEPILIVAMAVLVGFVAVSMLMAVFDLTSGLSI